jgi:pimeloyl-ACP methyl ester carboxylesterase
MSNNKTESNITAPTKFTPAGKERYAYRRFGAGSGLPLLCLQHFTGTMDNWDPAVTDPLAAGREMILFESAGIGRSSGSVPNTIAGMAAHAFAFLDSLAIRTCDVLGFSLGGMVAQQMALERPSTFRRMMLVGTAPRGVRTSCTWKSRAWPNLSVIPRFKDMLFCRRFSLRQRRQARRRVPPLSKELCNATRIVSLPLGRGGPSANGRVSRMGASFRRTPFRSEENSPSDTCREWRPRRNDSRLELVLAKCASSKCGAADLPGLRARLALPVPRVVYPAGYRVPRLGIDTRPILGRERWFNGDTEIERPSHDKRSNATRTQCHLWPNLQPGPS